MAMAAGEVNSNIVGYVTKATAAGKTDILGAHFQNIGDTAIDVQNVLPGAGFVTNGRDILRVWNPSTATYEMAYYWSQTYDALDNPVGPGWANTNQDRLDIPIDPGQGFWLMTVNNASVTIAGEVLDATDNQLSTVAGKTDMLCNTYPVGIDIQDIAPVSGFVTNGRDILRVWNPSTATYEMAYYWSQTYDALDNPVGPGWANTNQDRLDIPITAGQGFWLMTVNNATLSFPVPTGILP